MRRIKYAGPRLKNLKPLRSERGKLWYLDPCIPEARLVVSRSQEEAWGLDMSHFQSLISEGCRAAWQTAFVEYGQAGSPWSAHRSPEHQSTIQKLERLPKVFAITDPQP